MKFNPFVISDQCKNWKRPSHIRRKMVFSPLSEELGQKYDGQYKGPEWRVVQVYRKKYAVSIEWVQEEKANDPTVHVSIRLSKVVVTRLKLDKDCSKQANK
ncbi:hypothetical protein U0070_025196 [Myodes glareolus]|uniref:Uncharacterized protein n=1 Tax=Myodes glareolus TaxID=447135 RepID=A0AAW0JC51_MYOGA